MARWQTRSTDIAIARLTLGAVDYVVLREDAYQRLRRPGSEEEGDIADLIPPAADEASIGRRIRERRLQAGLTQAELARRAGVRAETLNRIERARTTPDFATLRKLSAALRAATPRA